MCFRLAAFHSSHSRLGGTDELGAELAPVGLPFHAEGVIGVAEELVEHRQKPRRVQRGEDAAVTVGMIVYVLDEAGRVAQLHHALGVQWLAQARQLGHLIAGRHDGVGRAVRLGVLARLREGGAGGEGGGGAGVVAGRLHECCLVVVC